MPQYCSVRKCKSTLRKNNGISFHCYPKDENRRQLWLNALRLNALKWDCRPRVCSKHFKKEDFVFGGNVVKLKKSAIPSVGSVNDGVPALGEMQNIPSSSTTTIENENTPKMPVPETRPANCMSPSVCSTSNVLTETPGVSHYRVETAINTKQQRKHSTSKVSENVSSDVSMTWVDDSVNADFSPLKEHRLTLTTNVVKTPTKITKIQTKKPVSDATGNPISSSVTMSWISDLPEDQPDQAGNDELNTLTTSTPQIEKDSMEICKGNCSSLKTVEILENEVAYLKRENQRLQLLSLPKPLFCLQQFSANDKKILYYTGFQTYEILCLVFKWVLLPSGDLKDITIYDASPRVKKHERLSKLSAENHFFLTLIRLRRGMSIETLSDMFSISKAYVNSIFLSWINLLYLRLGSLDIWPNRNELINRASHKMRQNYPNVIGSIDCTEFFIQRPSSLVKQSQCYSNYKGATTLKSLIMIDPAGAIIYTSPLFTGSISDKAIIEVSGFIDILKEKVNEGKIFPGDTILADKGFNVRDLFQAINLDINIPVFKVGGTQFTTEEVSTIRKVAHERIHVERAIGRLKNYNILSSKIPISSLGAIQQIYTVCILLSNFRYGLVTMKTNT